MAGMLRLTADSSNQHFTPGVNGMVEERKVRRARFRALSKTERARVDLRAKRRAVHYSQLKLSDCSDVSRYKIQLYEQGLGELSSDEFRRVMLVIEHATEAARSSAAEREKAVVERLEQEETARKSEAAAL